MTILLSNPPSLQNPTFKISQIHNPKIQAAAAAAKLETETLNYHQYQQRRSVVTGAIVVLGTGWGINNNNNNAAMAASQSWGTRSTVWERYFGSELSPEESAERIKLTAEGLHTLREMLEHFSWKYVLVYIRAKKSYLSKDVKNALVLVPQAQKNSYVQTANELVDNMSELDNYVRTPKIYESYLYYEKTLKSIDDLVAILA